MGSARRYVPRDDKLGTREFNPAFTAMAGLQASWDFLNDFQERAAQSKWGVPPMAASWAPTASASLEDEYLP